MVFLTQPGYIVETIVAYHQAVRVSGGHSLQAFLRICPVYPFPVRMTFGKKGFIISVAIIDRYPHISIHSKNVRIGNADYGTHLGVQQSRRHHCSFHLCFVTAQIGRKYAVYLSFF